MFQTDGRAANTEKEIRFNPNICLDDGDNDDSVADVDCYKKQKRAFLFTCPAVAVFSRVTFSQYMF